MDNDVIIEIFCIITNGDLNVLDENGWGTVVHQTKEKMDKMVCSPKPGYHKLWTKKQYRANGAPESMAKLGSLRLSLHPQYLPSKQPPTSSNISRSSYLNQSGHYWRATASMPIRRSSDKSHMEK